MESRVAIRGRGIRVGAEDGAPHHDSRPHERADSGTDTRSRPRAVELPLPAMPAGLSVTIRDHNFLDRCSLLGYT